ncbi:hypothetical protein EV177_007306 [Coemansia sp. RSA 1804]|nr:hypothetical protein EV177_007306 [Coemansia sp. RSA 1804]
MSYIPRPPASAVATRSERPVGRADEVRSVSSSHSNNSATIVKLFAGSPSTVTGADNLVRIPSSTRASIVKVFADDSSLPVMPPMPGMDLGSVSIASTSTNTNTNITTAATTAALAPSASSHRRTVSAGNQVKLIGSAHPNGIVPSEPTQLPTPALQTDIYGVPDNSGANKGWSKLGLSSLRDAWSHARARHDRYLGTGTRTQMLQWTAEEVGTLAARSAQYWRHGIPVDYGAISGELDRPTGEVRDMLEYMLHGYVRFGGGAFWVGESPELVLGWAAREFPKSPVLNPLHVMSNSTLARSRSRLDTCLAALRCRPQSAAHLDTDTYTADRRSIMLSAQNVVGDFREGMHMHSVDALSLPQRKLSAAASSSQHKSSDSTANATDDDSTSNSASRPNTAESAQNPPAIAPADSTPSENKDVPIDRDLRLAVGNVPLFTGGLRNHHALNTLNREARAKRTRGSFRAEPSLTAVLNGNTAENGSSAPFTFTVLPAKPPPLAAAKIDKGTSPLESSSHLPARQRAHTVAHTELVGQTTQSMHPSRDSGNVDLLEIGLTASALIDDTNHLASLPNAIGASRSDSELDAQFGDIGSETRQKVRRFVTQFISKFPSDFQQRVMALQAGKDGLCITIDNFTDFEYNNDAFLKAIETIYRHGGGSVIYTYNMFFHVQMIHAIRIDRIPVADNNWLRVNEFATSVFNKKIEDAQYVVMEEYTDSKRTASPVSNGQSMVSTSVVAKEPLPLASVLSPGASRSRYDSITCSEGNEHKSPFERAFYMDKLARRYVRFFLGNNSDEILKRARNSSYRPMPVALQVDESKMQVFDVEIRCLLISFIWEDIPLSTQQSKEITLLRALELLNGEIADRCSFRLINMRELIDKTKNEDGSSDDDKVIADISAVKEMPAGGLAQALGKSFARQYFEEDKERFLEAMLHDHPFRPIERDELNEWITRGSSPFGDDIDFRMNVRLYKYLRRLRVRPSDKQWMQASGAATLSMLRRVKNAILDKGYLEHIDTEACAQRFKDIVRDTRVLSDGSSLSKSSLQNRSNDASKLRLSAFGKVPAWVSLLTEPQSTDDGSPKQASIGTNANAHPTDQPPRRSSVHSANIANGPTVQDVPRRNSQTRKPPVADGGNSNRPSSIVNGTDRAQRTSSIYTVDTITTADLVAAAAVEATQQQQRQSKASGLNPIDQVGANRELGPGNVPLAYQSQYPHQLKDSVSMPGLIQQYTVPMPSGNYQHLSQPASATHVHQPYVPIDALHHMPAVYPSITAHPSVSAQSSGQTNMDAVMRKFEEMQELFRQMQVEKTQ